MKDIGPPLREEVNDVNIQRREKEEMWCFGRNSYFESEESVYDRQGIDVG